MKECIIGAEAKIWIKDKIVIKERVKKTYRHPMLDEKLRKERIKSEARIVEKCRQIGINVPKLLKIEDFKIYFEKIEGTLLINLKRFSLSIIKDFASQVALMHNHNIIHGDLTLKNAIKSKNDDKIYILDFGLSFTSSRYEDKGMDLYVLEETSKIKNFPIEKFYKVYFNKVKYSEHIKAKLEKIRKRRRYINA